MHCIICHAEPVAEQRFSLGYKTCLKCGEKLARAKKHCIVPLHKSHCMVVTDKQMLKSLNKYAKD